MGTAIRSGSVHAHNRLSRTAVRRHLPDIKLIANWPSECAGCEVPGGFGPSPPPPRWIVLVNKR
jgi:hypothetical protein